MDTHGIANMHANDRSRDRAAEGPDFLHKPLGDRHFFLLHNQVDIVHGAIQGMGSGCIVRCVFGRVSVRLHIGRRWRATMVIRCLSSRHRACAGCSDRDHTFHARLRMAGYRADEGQATRWYIEWGRRRCSWLGRDLRSIGKSDVMEHRSIVNERDRVMTCLRDAERRRLKAEVEGMQLKGVLGCSGLWRCAACSHTHGQRDQGENSQPM